MLIILLIIIWWTGKTFRHQWLVQNHIGLFHCNAISLRWTARMKQSCCGQMGTTFSLLDTYMLRATFSLLDTYLLRAKGHANRPMRKQTRQQDCSDKSSRIWKKMNRWPDVTVHIKWKPERKLAGNKHDCFSIASKLPVSLKEHDQVKKKFCLHIPELGSTALQQQQILKRLEPRDSLLPKYDENWEIEKHEFETGCWRLWPKVGITKYNSELWQKLKTPENGFLRS